MSAYITSQEGIVSEICYQHSSVKSVMLNSLYCNKGFWISFQNIVENETKRMPILKERKMLMLTHDKGAESSRFLTGVNIERKFSAMHKSHQHDCNMTTSQL
jgi:hypothetical protein